jgi:hypothetical protein
MIYKKGKNTEASEFQKVPDSSDSSDSENNNQRVLRRGLPGGHFAKQSK